MFDRRLQRLTLAASCFLLVSSCATTRQPRAAAVMGPATSNSTPQEPAGAPEGGGDAELAKKLSNPVASLISVPLQLNYDENIGRGDDGERWTLNLQPVVPIGISDDWNVIWRTILPVIDQQDVIPGDDHQDGLGDTTLSLFLSPKQPTAGGLVWGAGPVFLIPTATDDPLGLDQWGIGPTGVVLKQQGRWTYGGLANHLWKLSGSGDQPDIDQTFLQPFVSYTTPEAWTFTLNSESTYNWKESDWAVPLNALVSKLTRFGKLPVSLFGGLRYWLDSAEGGPEDFGLRFGMTLLFPK